QVEQRQSGDDLVDLLVELLIDRRPRPAPAVNGFPEFDGIQSAFHFVVLSVVVRTRGMGAPRAPGRSQIRRTLCAQQMHLDSAGSLSPYPGDVVNPRALSRNPRSYGAPSVNQRNHALPLSSRRARLFLLHGAPRACPRDGSLL